MKLSYAATICALAFLGATGVQAYSRAKMLCLVNEERDKQGLKNLGPDGRLDNAAQRHSDDQAQHKVMTHDGTDGSSPSKRITDAGYDWRSSAENVAYGYPDEETCMVRWMKSDGHRKNILRSTVTHFGSAVGHASDERRTPYYTQVFAGDGKEHSFPRCPGEATPAPPPPKPKPAPAPAPEPIEYYEPEPEPAPAPAPEPTPAPPSAYPEPGQPPQKKQKKPKKPKKQKKQKKQKKSKKMPTDWECIKRYTNGECHRWKKCTENVSSWSCTEKWVGTP